MRTSLVTVKIWFHIFIIVFNGDLDPQFALVAVSMTSSSSRVVSFGGLEEAVTHSQYHLYSVSYLVPSILHLGSASVTRPGHFAPVFSNKEF